MTTMLEQYMAFKKQMPDELVLWQLGDFYEALNDDAHQLSETCDLVLTSRSVGKNQRIPMCGFPIHALQSYLPRLTQVGFTVALVEQVGTEPIDGSIPRAIRAVYTPGYEREEAEKDKEPMDEKPHTNGRLPGLAPDAPPQYKARELALKFLPPDEDLLRWTAPPTSEFKDDIATFGVRVPVELRWDGEIDTPILPGDVLAGRKRIIAARAAGFKSIPVRYAPDLTEEQGWAVIVSDNALRKENPLTDLHAIEAVLDRYIDMIAPGVDPQDLDTLPASAVNMIARELRLPVGTVKNRLRLRKLVPELREGVYAGQVAVSTAFQAARLPREVQVQLANVLAENGKLTGADVSDARRVKISHDVSAWDIDTPDLLPEPESTPVQASGPDDRISKVVSEIEAFLAIKGTTKADMTAMLKAVMETLQEWEG